MALASGQCKDTSRDFLSIWPADPLGPTHTHTGPHRHTLGSRKLHTHTQCNDGGKVLRSPCLIYCAFNIRTCFSWKKCFFLQQNLFIFKSETCRVENLVYYRPHFNLKSLSFLVIIFFSATRGGWKQSGRPKLEAAAHFLLKERRSPSATWWQKHTNTQTNKQTNTSMYRTHTKLVT